MPAPTTAAQDTERQFLRAFFHDLAAALSGLSLQVELAHRRAARGESPSSALADSREALARALSLFEGGRELLMRGPASPESFDFDSWVEEIASESGSGPALRGRTDGRVFADRARLTRALAALITNARDASPDVPPALVRRREAGLLRVEIENPGRLTEPDTERLFSPRAAREGRDWGFGLAAARLYASEAEGRVTLSQRGPLVVAALELPEARP